MRPEPASSIQRDATSHAIPALRRQRPGGRVRRGHRPRPSAPGSARLAGRHRRRAASRRHRAGADLPLAAGLLRSARYLAGRADRRDRGAGRRRRRAGRHRPARGRCPFVTHRSWRRISQRSQNRSGLSQDEVVRRHAGATYQVYMLGFLPGFAYLGDLDAALRLPRRTTPRTRLPAGSVAIAQAMTAVYPVESPGGWHLIGNSPGDDVRRRRRPAGAAGAGRHGAVPPRLARRLAGHRRRRWRPAASGSNRSRCHERPPRPPSGPDDHGAGPRPVRLARGSGVPPPARSTASPTPSPTLWPATRRAPRRWRSGSPARRWRSRPTAPWSPRWGAALRITGSTERTVPPGRSVRVVRGEVIEVAAPARERHRLSGGARRHRRAASCSAAARPCCAAGSAASRAARWSRATACRWRLDGVPDEPDRALPAGGAAGAAGPALHVVLGPQADHVHAGGDRDLARRPPTP